MNITNLFDTQKENLILYLEFDNVYGNFPINISIFDNQSNLLYSYLEIIPMVTNNKNLHRTFSHELNLKDLKLEYEKPIEISVDLLDGKNIYKQIFLNINKSQRLQNYSRQYKNNRGSSFDSIV